MREIVAQVGPYAAAAANNIALSQTPTSGTPLTLNGTLASGGVATLDSPRRVLLTVGSEAAPRTLTLSGTNWAGNPISEIIAVPATTAGGIISVLDYATVTSALPLGGGWTAAATLGTSAVTTAGSSQWIRLDDYGFAPVDLLVEVSGTVNWTIEQSDDDPNLTPPQVAIAPSAMIWISPDATNLSAKTATTRASLTTVPAWLRLTLNSYTNPGFAKLIARQPGGKGG